MSTSLKTMNEVTKAQPAMAAAGGGGGAAEAAVDEALEAVDRQPMRREFPKVGRNDPCPCGSGKKYKKCHGANA